jgi:LemA protein
MKTKLIVVAVIVVIAGIFLIWGVSGYNSLVSQDEAVSTQWAQVQNAYQRRSDLIPNLVSTVKGYAAHEQETFTQVTEARAKASQIQVDPNNLTPEKLQQFQAAQGELSQALGKLMMVREAYPELKANTNFLQLQDELAGTENRISTERNKFNEIAKGYNTSIRRFPRSIIASIGGFEKKAYFEADQAAQQAPKVEF